MTFLWPAMLGFLCLVPPAVLFYMRLQLRRQRMVEQFGSLGATPGKGTGLRSGRLRHIPPALFLTALILLTVSLARPQTVVSLPKLQGRVILAFDVSGSMAATDFDPTRMEAAKKAAEDFVQHQPPSVEIGVVAFSDSGYAMQSPTNDQGAVLAAIKRISTQKGTSLGHGIQAALNVIDSQDQQGPLLYSNKAPEPTAEPTPMPKGQYGSTVIILLSDGENNESPDPLYTAQSAADRGIRIYTVGIGSPQGTDLSVNGFTVHTTLNEEMLQQIAQLTGGEYYNAQNTQQLIDIYDHLDPKLVVTPQKMEVTSLMGIAGLGVLLVGGVLSMVWFRRVP